MLNDFNNVEPVLFNKDKRERDSRVCLSLTSSLSLSLLLSLSLSLSLSYSLSHSLSLSLSHTLSHSSLIRVEIHSAPKIVVLRNISTEVQFFGVIH